jgi:hypothetical protein
MDTTQRAGQAANCPLCGELPDELIVRTGRDESFPDVFNKLILVGGDDFTSWGDSSQDYRCPNCGAKFVCENHTSFTGSGINDEAVIMRASVKAARDQVSSPSDDRAAAAAAEAKRAAAVEAAHAQQAFSIMEKHFASAGAVMKDTDPPKDWPRFCALFYSNTNEFLKRGQHTKMLTGLLAELVDYIEKFSGGDFNNNMYELLSGYRHYGWLKPILPDSARGMASVLEGMWEEKRLEGEELAEQIRLGQMSY